MKTHLSFKLLVTCLLSVPLLLSLGCKKEDTPARDKFLGSYNVNDVCDSGNWNYSSTITASSGNEDAIIIGNFGDFGVNVRAIVSDANINFNDTQDGINFSGSGNLSGNTLSIIYTASEAGLTDNCTATCIKQ